LLRSSQLYIPLTAFLDAVFADASLILHLDLHLFRTITQQRSFESRLPWIHKNNLAMTNPERSLSSSAVTGKSYVSTEQALTNLSPAQTCFTRKKTPSPTPLPLPAEPAPTGRCLKPHASTATTSATLLARRPESHKMLDRIPRCVSPIVFPSLKSFPQHKASLR
jgi:hypothetical protein